MTPMEAAKRMHDLQETQRIRRELADRSGPVGLGELRAIHREVLKAFPGNSFTGFDSSNRHLVVAGKEKPRMLVFRGRTPGEFAEQVKLYRRLRDEVASDG